MKYLMLFIISQLFACSQKNIPSSVLKKSVKIQWPFKMTPSDGRSGTERYKGKSIGDTVIVHGEVYTIIFFKG